MRSPTFQARRRPRAAAPPRHPGYATPSTTVFTTVLNLPRTIALTIAAAFAFYAAPAAARPADPGQRPKPTLYDAPAPASGGAVSFLSSGAALNDTVCYGGTVVDGQPDPIPGAVPPLRPFKATRNGTWSFESGIGSNFTEPTASPKPPGYHHGLEGWTGRDLSYHPLPYYRRNTLCVLNGSYSMYAGLSLLEAQALCYTSGQGYGNNWSLTIAKTFAYPGSGNVTLSYRYRTECEPDFDYLYVNIDTSGTGADDDVNITVYTGNNPAATATHTLIRGVTMRSTAGPVTLKFNATSDGAYSDEDGDYATVCGHSSVDDIQLSGAIADFSDFESGTNGWAALTPLAGPGGEWSDLRTLGSLPPPLSFCPCAIADTVLVFNDLSGGHDTDVDNIACSPWIDLLAGGDAGRPGKLIAFHGYFELPLTNYFFVQTLASWYPAICPGTGLVYVKPPTSDGFVRYFGGVPNCTAPGAPTVVDFSAVIPPSAEQVRICLGVLSYCLFFSNCTGVTNSTPWLDDVSLCVFGTAGAPIVTQRTIDVFQDNFAADGTLNPMSFGRIDVNDVKGGTTPQPGTTLGDTLVVNGDGGNQEVRVVFHVRPGPFTQAGNLATWAANKWTPETGLGAGWYSARCDTAEQGGTKSPGKWMSALHEADPHFGGGTDTDRGGEGDFSQLSHDIFPDHILTPGSRIDYFVAARYIPPDPRNPGGTAWYVTPDTTGGRYKEVEILPSSFGVDTTWNCTLYVNHHADRDEEGRRLEEQGLTAALGSGGHNAEGTKFDRYDVQAPTSQMASFGRPLNTQYGASIIQTFAYKVIAWHSGNLAAFNLVDEDANNLAAWLTINEVGNNRLWLSGDGIAKSMATEGEPTTISLLNNVLGMRYTCDSIRLATCPTGSMLTPRSACRSSTWPGRSSPPRRR